MKPISNALPIDEALARLDALPVRNKVGRASPLRDAVAALYDKILVLLNDRNYTLDAVAAVLKDMGYPLSANTLKVYLKQEREARAAAASASAPSEVEPVAPVAEVEPVAEVSTAPETLSETIAAALGEETASEPVVEAPKPKKKGKKDAAIEGSNDADASA